MKKWFSKEFSYRQEMLDFINQHQFGPLDFKFSYSHYGGVVLPVHVYVLLYLSETELS